MSQAYPRGRTPLHEAAESGDAAAAQRAPLAEAFSAKAKAQTKEGEV